VHKGLKKLLLRFDETLLTHFGGLVLIQRFCNKLQLRRLLQRRIRFRQRGSDYPPADAILALLFAIIAGLRRINKTEIRQYNGTFHALLGIAQFPNQSTLRRFLHRLTPKEIRQLVVLHDQLPMKLFALDCPRSSLIFDLDSVVLVLYGQQQGGRVGYNPKKPGRRSYHPLLCFEAQRHEFWHGSLRSGNTTAATGVIPFVRVCLSRVPGTIARGRIRFRADAGFFGRKLIEYLDEVGCRYAVVAQLHSRVKQRVVASSFETLGNGWEAGEFQYQPYRWQVPHRFIVVRRPIPEDPDEARQLTLFRHQNYAYHVIVTNLMLSPWRVWRFYAGRANIEKSIRELIYDYPLAHIPTGGWVANVAFFQLVLLAYNIVNWLKHLYLPEEYRCATLDTIRRDFLAVPAKLTKRGNRNVLHLPRDYPHRRQFAAAFRKLEQLRT
jgi:hypothetical protein